MRNTAPCKDTYKRT